ncbi:MAG TPA: HAMP domain-containing sensor histidine kinase [Roseiarcus sp.]
MLDLPARNQTGAQTPALAEALARHAKMTGVPVPWRGFGLAGRVLAVTVTFVLVAMALFYVTRLTAYREAWLHNKIASAQTAIEAFDVAGPVSPADDLSRRILNSLVVKSIAVQTPSGRRELALPGAAPATAMAIIADDNSYFEGVGATFRTLFTAPGTIVKVGSSTPPDEAAIELTFDETPLIDALWRVSRNFLNISLTIAAVVTCVLWAALWTMVLRPVRRLTSNIIAFGERPQDASRVIAPSGRRNEIGRAETALAVMQRTLAHELAQRKRLAELGMAVARINHDLRNMLTAAQLISDRLATIPDPLAQRLAPRLVATLDRAIQFCQSTLTYGAGRELPPSRRRFDLRELVRQAVDAVQAESGPAIDYNIDIPPRFCLYADPDHILRVLENLGRNAAQALMANGAEDGRPKAIRFAAIRTEGLALIEISDTGPGFPADQAQRIFEPFHTSTSQAGAGLGLAIAADLVTRNGGAIALAPAKADDFYCGARFLIKLPTPEGAARKAARILPEA